MININTDRLTLCELNSDAADFILELVNTNGWLTFIGDRKIYNRNDAITYIKKIKDNSAITYWIIKLKESPISIGVLTLIKRDYLEHSDIGFALLPLYSKQGYAYEATISLMNNLI